MKIGQMSFNRISEVADYLQLDICGLTVEEVVSRYRRYNKDIAVVLHGDWTKKGCSENNLIKRREDYINIINTLKKETTVIGLTLHPPYRNKVTFKTTLQVKKCIEDKTGIPVFLENRSQEKNYLSTPSEIIEFSLENLMTIDIPQLLISCKYNYNIFLETIKNINHSNVAEYHLANIKKIDGKTFVARNIKDPCGLINYNEIIKYLNKDSLFTLEILGHIKAFNLNKEELLNLALLE